MKKKSVGLKCYDFIRNLGPGLVTGASDDDPSGIATYSQSGAQFGFATLWTSILTFPLMIAIQGMCAKIGIVTSEGLATNIKKHYPLPLLYLVMLLSFPAIILNIGADIAGMGAVAHLIIPGIPSQIFAIFFTIFLLAVIIYLPYKKFAKYLKYFCLSLLLYILIPFLVKTSWQEVAKFTFIPHVYFNKEYISILVAIFGTTISPYLFFWQTTMEAEEMRHKKVIMIDKEMKHEMKQDVPFGMFFSTLIMYFIILTTGTTLFPNGIQHIDTVEQAAKALEPIAGKLSYLLFAAGVIGTGCLAIPVLSGCLAYIMSSTFNLNNGLDKKFHQAKLFYLIISVALLLGLGIELIGISPIHALIYTAILYGLSAPILILIILHIANNKKIMGKYTNNIWINLFSILAFIIMTTCAILLVYFQIVGS